MVFNWKFNKFVVARQGFMGRYHPGSCFAQACEDPWGINYCLANRLVLQVMGPEYASPMRSWREICHLSYLVKGMLSGIFRLYRVYSGYNLIPTILSHHDRHGDLHPTSQPQTSLVHQ